MRMCHISMCESWDFMDPLIDFPGPSAVGPEGTLMMLRVALHRKTPSYAHSKWSEMASSLLLPIELPSPDSVMSNSL